LFLFLFLPFAWALAPPGDGGPDSALGVGGIELFRVLAFPIGPPPALFLVVFFFAMVLLAPIRKITS